MDTKTNVKDIFCVKNVLLFLFLSCAICITGCPAWPDSILINQSDGSSLWIYDMGDESYNWIESTDGYVIVSNSEGLYEYAMSINGELIPSGTKVHNVQDKDCYEKDRANELQKNVNSTIQTLYNSHKKVNKLRTPNLPSSPVVGTRKILTILVGFTDKPFTYTLSNFDSLMNTIGYSAHGNAGSVRDYYYENSYGQLTIQSTVIGPFTAAHVSTYYSRPIGGNGGNAASLVVEAINWADGQGVDFSAFDGNNDGNVDCIHIVFAGNQYSTGGNGIIWPFNSAFQTSIIKDGKTISDFIMTPEKLGNNDNEISSVGVICHEIGHVLGAPDFYGLNANTNDREYIGTGIWDVMSMGAHNCDGKKPPHHNPFTKTVIFQWTTPVIINAAQANTVYNVLASSQLSGYIYKINTTTTGEYYLVENRQKISFDSCISYNGLLIYHISSDIIDSIGTNSVYSTLPQRCYLVNPGSSQNTPSTLLSYGESYLNVFSYPLQDNIFFTSQTCPRSQSWAGDSTGVDICFIQHDGNNMKFVVNPTIEGPTILTDSSWYYIRNVPSDATITWNITNNTTNPMYTLVSSRYCDSVYVANRNNSLNPWNPLSLNDSLSIEGIHPPLPVHRGTLSVSISCGTTTTTYTIKKTIRESAGVISMMPQLVGSTDESTLNVQIKNFDSLLTTGQSSTLELWHPIYGRMRTQRANNTMEQINILGLPKGVYILLLRQNGNPIAQTKVMVP